MLLGVLFFYFFFLGIFYILYNFQNEKDVYVASTER